VRKILKYGLWWMGASVAFTAMWALVRSMSGPLATPGPARNANTGYLIPRSGEAW